METYGCRRRTTEHRAGSQLPDYVQTVVVKDSKGLDKILLLPKALDLDRPKRSRTAFAKWQLDALETTFGSHPYLVGEQRTSLARRLGLSETQIKVWYQNRRTKQRKEAIYPTGSAPEEQRTSRTWFADEAASPLGPQSSVMQEPSGSSPEMQLKWRPPQRHPAINADFFGQAFQHYQPAMYQQLIQSYSSSHQHSANGSATSGAITAITASGASHSNGGAAVPPAAMSADRAHHQIHRVY